MSEEIIGMEDMMSVYEITDIFGIDRESITVPLGKTGAGKIEKLADGSLEITVPVSPPVREWLPELRVALEELGFEAQDNDDVWE